MSTTTTTTTTIQQLRSGGGSGDVLIFDVENREQPTFYSPGGEGSKGQGAEITQVSFVCLKRSVICRVFL